LRQDRSAVLVIDLYRAFGFRWLVTALRVLHVTPYYEPAYVYGGPTRSIPALCQGLARQGVDVHVYTTNANGSSTLDVPPGEVQVRNDVTVRYFARWPGLRSFFAPDLLTALHRTVPHFDLVHVEGMWSAPVSAACSVSRRAGVPYIVSPRGMLMPWEFNHKAWKKLPFFLLVELRSLFASRAIHCTSEAEVSALARWGLASHAFIVPNAVDLAELDRLPTRGLLRRELGIRSHDTIVLFLGRLHPKKGIEITLEVFERLCSQVDSLHLVLAGPDEGNYRLSVPAWASDHGLSDRIHLTGALEGDRRLAAYADADLFTLLSESENFATSVAEAMAAGLPVVVTPGVGVSDAVRTHHTGLVASGDANEIATATAALLHDRARRAAMSVAARQLARESYAADSVATAMRKEYERLLQPGRTA
jgi:glycosyltransferase involved in cell wall biosynthesis